MKEGQCVQAVCPKCNYTNTVFIAYKEQFDPKVVICDCDDGEGCGEYFAIAVTFEPRVRTYEMSLS